jgi:hypothetical protein
MKNVKVKTFKSLHRIQLEDDINKFICEDIEECDVIDIKIHVDSKIDPNSYFAMLLYV